jgi:hypothetical protein
MLNLIITNILNIMYFPITIIINNLIQILLHIAKHIVLTNTSVTTTTITAAVIHAISVIVIINKIVIVIFNMFNSFIVS